MKKLLILLLLSSTILSAQKIPIDKQLHFGAGAVVGGWGTMTVKQEGIKPVIAGISWTILAGAGKELADYGGMGHADIKDFGATVIGGVVSVDRGLTSICRWYVFRGIYTDFIPVVINRSRTHYLNRCIM